MKKSDIGFKLIMTVVWGFAGWVVWCLGSMIRIAAAPYSFFRFFDYLIAGAFVLVYGGGRLDVGCESTHRNAFC